MWKETESLRATIPNTYDDRSKQPRMWSISTILVAWQQLTHDVQVILNTILPCQKQHSTRRLFSPANWI